MGEAIDFVYRLVGEHGSDGPIYPAAACVKTGQHSDFLATIITTTQADGSPSRVDVYCCRVCRRIRRESRTATA